MGRVEHFHHLDHHHFQFNCCQYLHPFDHHRHQYYCCQYRHRLDHHYRQYYRCQYRQSAVLYYTSQYFIWWDFGGMTIQDRNTGGIHPNCRHPKPRPTTPQDFVDSIDLQYQKETC